jgi:hypothetical protein
MSDPLKKTVILADAAARVPWPGVPGRLIPQEPFEVSIIDPFWAALIADHTLIDPLTEAEKPVKSKS